MKTANKTVGKRSVAALAAVILVIGCVLGGTLAYLVSKPAAKTNVFTVGKVEADLTETDRQYHIVPGSNIKKDPKAVVKAGSEACYLFVQINEANWPTATEANGGARKVDWKIADGWETVAGETNVYVREVSASADEQSFPILKDNQVTVSANLTKDELTAYYGETAVKPELTFTVYAVQQANVDTVAAAWTIAKGN